MSAGFVPPAVPVLDADVGDRIEESCCVGLILSETSLDIALEFGTKRSGGYC